MPPTCGAAKYQRISNFRKATGRYIFCFMIAETKARKIGNSLGAIIPKDVAARLNIKERATLYFTAPPPASG